MKCCALGVLELLDVLYDIDTVIITIYQPSRGNINSWEISRDDLLSGRKTY
jgi:hypothetical protein